MTSFSSLKVSKVGVPYCFPYGHFNQSYHTLELPPKMTSFSSLKVSKVGVPYYFPYRHFNQSYDTLELPPPPPRELGLD